MRRRSTPRLRLPADQGQHDGHDGGQQGPEGSRERGGRTLDQNGGILIADAQNDQQHDKDTQRNEIRYLGTFVLRVCDLPPHNLVSPSYPLFNRLSTFQQSRGWVILNKL